MPAAAEKGRVRPLAALYILERIFHVMADGRLLNPLIAALMGSDNGGPPRRGVPRFEARLSGGPCFPPSS